VFAPPAAIGGVVYVGSGDHNMYALDTETGSQRWRFATGNRIDSSPVVVDDTVYVGCRDDNLYALDTATGQ
jgi:outer membrane protein assembly factor BamB